MKNIVMTSIFLLFGSLAAAQSKVKLGEISFAGTSCQLDPSDTLTAVIRNGRLQIPLTSTIQKLSGESISRGTCQFSLPLRLPANHRLVLRNASVIGNLNLAPRMKSLARVEIFQTGSQGQPLVSEVQAGRARLNKPIHLRGQGEVLVSGCGERMILRGNASVVLQGEGRASGSLYYVHTIAKLEACR